MPPAADYIKEILIALGAVAIGGGGATWFLLRFNRRLLSAQADQASAEAELSRVAAADRLIDQLQEEYARFCKERDAARRRQNDLVGHIATLEHKLDDARQRVRALEEQVRLLLTENATLKARITELESQVVKWRRAYESLCAWVRDRGLEPPGNGG